MRRTQEGLLPFKDDKTKCTENSQFEAASVLVVKATGRIETSLVSPWKGNREEIITINKIINTNVTKNLVCIAYQSDKLLICMLHLFFK